MVKIEFIDSTEEMIEVQEEKYCRAFNYVNAEQSYVVFGIEGEIHYPREFVKSIREIEV